MKSGYAPSALSLSKIATYAAGLQSLVRAARGYASYKGGSAAHKKAVNKMFRRTFKRKAFRKKRVCMGKRKRSGLKSRVRTLEKRMKGNESEKTTRFIESAMLREITTLKQQVVGTYYINDLNYLQSVALANLKFYDPSTPGTLITASGATGTYAHSYRIKSWLKARIRNGCNFPIEVVVYRMSVKEDTSHTVVDAWTDGLLDGSNLSAYSQVHFTYPRDSNVLTSVYNTGRGQTFIIQPGEECVQRMACRTIRFDPSVADEHSLLYQKDYQCKAIVVVVKGVLGHNDGLTDSGPMATHADVQYELTSKVWYNSGGPRLKYLEVTDNRGALVTASSSMASKPVGDVYVFEE